MCKCAICGDEAVSIVEIRSSSRHYKYRKVPRCKKHVETAVRSFKPSELVITPIDEKESS